MEDCPFRMLEPAEIQAAMAFHQSYRTLSPRPPRSSSSASKDLQASLEAARAADVLDRVLVVHAELGDNEWPGTGALATEHAAHYGLPFKTVRREYDGQVETILDRCRNAACGQMQPAAGAQLSAPSPAG